MPDNGVIMPGRPLDIVLPALALYLVAGAAFAVWFVIRGAGRLDPVARQGSRGFRLLLLPGATLLWPLLAARLARGGPAAEERTPHRTAAGRPDA
jgi:hypothetical protein